MNFKNILKKENIMPVAVLSAICLVVAILMSVVNMITAPEIERAEIAAIQASLSEVMADGEFEKIDTPEGAPKTVTAVYRDKISGGKVVTLLTSGYGGEIAITVGVDTEGKITRAVITKESETHGQAGMKNYTDNFAGLDAEGVNGVEKFSQATISSTTIKNAIYDAMIALGYATVLEEVLPKTDEEIKAAAEALAGKTLAPVELGDNAPETLKRLYEGDGVFAAYLVVPGAYVPVATEGMVTFDKNGTILAVELYQWVVGHGKDYTPEFLNSFVGKTAASIEGVELVTEATGTSTDFRNAVGAALAYATPEPKIYSIIGIIILVLAIAAPVAFVIYKNRRRKV